MVHVLLFYRPLLIEVVQQNEQLKTLLWLAIFERQLADFLKEA